MALSSLPWTCLPDGLVIAVRLTPRSSKDAVEGVEHLSDGKAILKARVRAVPEDGKANAALIKLLAKTFATSASKVQLQSGATARIKILKIEGAGAELAKQCAALFG